MYECTSTNLRCKDNKLVFQKGKGFTNPFNHLKQCFCIGSSDDLLSIHEENFRGQQNNFSQFLKTGINITTQEKTIAIWIQLIVEESPPLAVIYKKEFNFFNGSAEQLVFFQEKLKETLYNMVEMIEGQISSEMKDAT